VSERAFQAWCVQQLRAHGAWVVKIHGGPHGSAGTPDLLCCYRGMFVAVEVKNPDRPQPLTALQRKALDGIVTAGGVAVRVASRADLIDLLAELEELSS
jgi:Holliday junction resolvase